jgi:hypothetical protein
MAIAEQIVSVPVERVFPEIATRGDQVVVFDGMAITPDGKFLYATATHFFNPVQSFVWAIDTTTSTVVLPELWSGTSGIAGLAVTSRWHKCLRGNATH